MEMKFVLILGCAAAVASDLAEGRIPNALVVSMWAAGSVLSACAGGAGGLLWFVIAALVPLAAGMLLFHFRMIGAGDIKLFSAASGFVGMAKLPVFGLMTLAIGGLISFFLMLDITGFRPRFEYLAHYIASTGRSGKIRPYIKKGNLPENLHFSVPVFLAAVLYAGGVI